MLMKQMVLAPAERADILVDFSKFAGQTLVMKNQMGRGYVEIVGSKRCGWIEICRRFLTADKAANRFALRVKGRSIAARHQSSRRV